MGDFIQKIESSYHAPEKSGQKPSVQRYPLTGIDVLVVGAGIGGLTAALECYRKGHSVRIFERESTISATGDMFSIGLSARRWFSHWPEMEKEFNEISPKVSLTTIKKHTGETAVIKAAMGRIEGDATKPSEEPMAIQMRAIFYRMLYNQVVKLNIEITYNKRAIEYTEDNKKAYVLTDDQQLASADVVVASDGIGSKSQYIVNKGNVETKRSGTAMYRAALPSAIAFADPVVVETFGLQEGQDAIVQVWMGPNTHAVVFVQKDVVTWAINYNESNSSKSSKESWHNTVDPSEVLETISATPGWGEGMRSLIRCTPASGIIHWPLIWRNPSPIWHSPQARIIQVGDSAHSFLPTSGSGGTQAIEDGISLAACLQLAASSPDRSTLHTSSIVSFAIRAHNTLRFERVSCAQKLGFANAFRYHHTDWEGAKKEPAKAQPKIPQWIWRHNPEIYAQERWEDVQAWANEEKSGDGSIFKNTNIPPGYVWSPWTIEDLVEEGKHGAVELQGDWT